MENIRLTPPNSVPSFLRWGGLLEFLEYCEDSCEDNKELTDSKNNLLELKNKITLIENSTNCKEIKEIVKRFTLENINYLNSPLLDEICATIDKSRPMLECCRKNKPRALEFYLTKEKFYKRNKGFLVASRKGYTEIIKILVKYGVNIRIKDDEALKNAIKNNYVEIAEILLRTASYYNYALSDAVREGYLEIIELLWKYSGRLLAPETINDAFRNACCNDKNINIVKFLVEKYKNIIPVYFALITSARCGSENIVMFLLESYNIKCLKNINLSKGGDFYQNYYINLHDDTFLSAAILGGNERVINKFLELDTSIDSDHLLRASASVRSVEIIEKISRHFPITERCIKNAVHFGTENVLEFLTRNYTGSYRCLLLDVCGWGANIKTLPLLYEKYKNSEINQDEFKNTLDACLLQACRSGTRPEIIEFLIHHGANPNDFQVLHATVNHANECALKMLIRHGADITIQNNILLKTVVIHASDGYAYEYRKNIVKLLIENGADIHVDNDYLLRLAREKENKPLIQFILSFIKK